MNRREFLRVTGLAAAAVVCKGCTPSKTSYGQGDKPVGENASRPAAPMIAACGLNCDDCEIGKAAKDPAFAEKLAARWRQSGKKAATADWFKCQGCHGQDDLVWSDDCKIRACCVKTKRLRNCAECGEFPCPLVDKFEKDGYAHHAKAVRFLKEIRQGKGKECPATVG